MDETEKENDTRFSFSAARIRDLASPLKGKRARYYDTKVRGLIVRVTANGVRTFYLYKWSPSLGRPIDFPLGRFPETTVEEARRLAQEKIPQINRGANPNAEKKALREEMTLKELFDYCLENDFKVHNKTWKEYEKNFNRYLKPMANRPVSSITRHEVHALHARIGTKNGKYAANRMLAILSSIFNRARARGYGKPNPCQGVKKFREKSRERFLEAHELPKFFKAVAEEENATVRDYVLLSLLTGARKGNVLSMKWEDIDFEGRTWLIPETKNGTSHTIPLTSEALGILEERKDNGSEYVFPSPWGKSYFNDPKKGWARILERAGLKNLRLHDLRRSLGSWQAATGANLSIIGKTLNHKTVATTAIYARLNLDPVRAAVEKATTAMLVAGGLKAADAEEAEQAPEAVDEVKVAV